jgi:hypothetical protein
MRQLIDGRYECALCGTLVDVPEDANPVVMLKSASGTPTLRTIVADGKEVHACPVGDLKPPQPT